MPKLQVNYDEDPTEDEADAPHHDVGDACDRNIGLINCHTTCERRRLIPRKLFLPPTHDAVLIMKLFLPEKADTG